MGWKDMMRCMSKRLEQRSCRFASGLNPLSQTAPALHTTFDSVRTPDVV
jgi:hypothetical protein